MEREVYDLFGIVFKNHPDLRRILLDYGFDGFPLNKDFPLKGFFETHYSDGQGKLTFKHKVDAVNEYKAFFMKNP